MHHACSFHIGPTPKKQLLSYRTLATPPFGLQDFNQPETDRQDQRFLADIELPTTTSKCHDSVIYYRVELARISQLHLYRSSIADLRRGRSRALQTCRPESIQLGRHRRLAEPEVFVSVIAATRSRTQRHLILIHQPFRLASSHS